MSIMEVIMEIIVGENAGFCYGVKRAVESAEKDIRENDEKIFCIGEIVHNKQVVESLESQGIKFIENIEETDGTTIIRAHGVPKSVYKYAEENNITLKDYTCPNVLKIHKIVEEYAINGYYILLFGAKNHPENIGTSSYCGDKYMIIEDEDALYNAIEVINRWHMDKVLVVAQTTFDLETFYIYEKTLRNELYKNIDLTIINTICNATEVRQKEVAVLSKKVDCMIIVGGKNSSNTKKLYYISRENCRNTICIETVDELKKEDFRFFQSVGIMAGASTPKKSIDDVYNFLKD